MHASIERDSKILARPNLDLEVVCQFNEAVDGAGLHV